MTEPSDAKALRRKFLIRALIFILVISAMSAYHVARQDGPQPLGRYLVTPLSLLLLLGTHVVGPWLARLRTRLRLAVAALGGLLIAIVTYLLMIALDLDEPHQYPAVNVIGVVWALTATLLALSKPRDY